MSCLWTVAAQQSWLWWVLLAQVVVVAGFVGVGVGYLLGADRWGDRTRRGS